MITYLLELNAELSGTDFCVVGTDFLVQVLESYLLGFFCLFGFGFGFGFFFVFCFFCLFLSIDSIITLQYQINYLMELEKLPFKHESLKFSSPLLSWVGLMLVCSC